uniref:Bola-like protein n=1 Tax=Bionectria ochroleuca TaxID=29856 RepID=A0A8H7K2V9_BIOOC
MLNAPRTAALLRRSSLLTSLRQCAPPRPAPRYLHHQTAAATRSVPATAARRAYSSSAASPAEEDDDLPSMTPAELSIAEQLSSNDTLSPTTSLLVRDVSGGCGSMYAIDIVSPKFKGKTLLAQQRLVTKALGDRVKEWHGVQIRTSVPSE